MDLLKQIAPISVLLGLGVIACTGEAVDTESAPDARAADMPGDDPNAPGPGTTPDAGPELGDDIPDDPEDNLADNAAFTAGDAGPGCPDAWECVTYHPRGAGAFSTSEEHARSGGQAASWSGDEEPAVVIKQGHPASAGQAFQIAAWYRSEHTTEPPFAQVMFHDETGAELDWEIFEGEAEARDWTRITSDPVVAPPGTARVQLNLSMAGSAGTVWWDDAVLVDVTGGDDELPPADYEVIPAEGQTIFIGDGEVFENVLIDLTTGQDITIDAKNSTGWTIRNVGFRGRKQAPGGLIGLSDTGGGHSVFENVYMGDGSSRAGGQPTCPDTSCTHGPTGIHVGPEHTGHIDFRRVNVQGWPDNGIYGSAPGTNAGGGRGSIHIDRSYGANNYVSTFRLAGSADRITDSVAFNTDEGYNGRPVWIWPSGPVTLEGVQLSGGSFGPALIAGANGNPTVVDIRDAQAAGILRADNGSTINRSNVGTSPDLSIPAGVPTSAEQAASGRAGHAQDPQSP